MLRSSARTLVLSLFMLAYLVFGAGVFMVLERSWEANIRASTRQVIKDFKLNNQCLDGEY